MNWFEAIVLGVVQGLTEFLPVSSSGHLVLGHYLFGFDEPELLFDICVHVGTLAAVVVVFRKDLAALVTALVRLPGLARRAGGMSHLLARNHEVRLMAMIVVGSVPTAILGVWFAGMAEQLFSMVWLVGVALLITGTFLWFTRHAAEHGRPISGMRWRDALLIGLAQGLAITPGISRSGATIAAALYLGIDRELAGRFSFLLSIPAIVGALVLGLNGEAFHTNLPWATIAAGSLGAAVVGYLALKLLLRVVRGGKLYRFAPYCWFVGAIALLLSII